MALSSNPSFLNDTQDNYANAKLKHSLLSDPVMEPELVQSNIPWKYEKIELLDSFVYKTNNIIRFQFPRNGLIDPRTLRMSFQVRGLIEGGLTPTTAYAAAFDFDINSLFSRCTLKCGRHQIISDMEQYNLFSRTISRMANEYQMTQTQRCLFLGMGTTFAYDPSSSPNGRLLYHSAQYTSRPQPLAVPRRYLVNINQGLFGQKKPIFLDAFHDDLVLEFTLDKPSVSTFLTTGNNNINSTTFVACTSIEIGNPTLHFTKYIPPPLLQNELSVMLASSRLAYQFHGIDYHRFNIKAQTKKHVFQIPISRKWLKYAVAIIRCDTDRDADQWASLRTYASIDPNNNPVQVNSIPAAAKWAKQSAIQQYFWKYGNQRIPEYPVRVSNTTPIYYDTNGVPITGAQNTGTQRFDFSVHQYNFVTPGVEAWYMVEQLFLRHKEKMLQMCPSAQDGNFLSLDPHSPYQSMANGGSEETVSSQQQNSGISAAPATNGRINCNFMMVGLFSESGYEGNMMALSGGMENESLELHFECVDISDNPTPEKNMFLDVFVSYDNIMQVTPNGIKLTN